jgi:hypothetical protein
VAPNLQQEGIFVNAILPGLVPSGLTDKYIGLVPQEHVTPVEAIVSGFMTFLDDETSMVGQAMEISLNNRVFRDHQSFADKTQKWLIKDSPLGQTPKYPSKRAEGLKN